MTTLQLLSRLGELNVRLWVEGGRLRYATPAGVLSPVLLGEMAARKMEIIELLREKGGHASVPSICRRAPGSPTPLSFAQERVWFMEELSPGSAFFNIDTAIRLNDGIDPNVLKLTLNELIRRHESLRTTFRTVGEQTNQIVAAELKISLPIDDLSKLPASDREAAATQYATEEARNPFDLARGPLIRARLLCLGPADWLFLITIHHIVTDGWSMGLFFDELNIIYTAFATGRPSPLPEPTLQYGDYAAWQRQWLRGEVLAKQLVYWKRQLDHIPDLGLPTDRLRPAIQTYRGADHTVTVPPTLASALKSLAQREGATLFMVLLTAFKVLLYRYTGQQDIAVGSYIANRNRKEIENIIGFFVNTLVFRTKVSGESPFRELLGRVRQVALDAYAHQDIPFTKLVEELQPDRDLGRNPLFQIVFHLFNAPTFNRNASNPASGPSAIRGDRGTAIFDLALHMWESPAGLHAQFEYNTDLFEHGTIKRMAAHFQLLLAAVCKNPDDCVSAIPLLAEGEHRRVVTEWNNTHRDYPLETDLVTLLQTQTKERPNAVAFREDGQDLTYEQLERNADRLAHALVTSGVKPGDIVGVCFDRSLRLPEAMFAVWKSGAIYLPLDPAYPPERLKLYLRETRAPFLLTTTRLRSSFAEGPEILTVEGLLQTASDNGHSVPRRGANELAYIIFTSGSTGTPKGIVVPHRQILNRLHWMWETYPFMPDEVSAQKTALSFVDSLWELLGPLLKGIPTVIISDRVLRDVFEFVDILNRERVTRLWVVPSFLRAILESYPDLSQRLPKLRFWVSTGETLSTGLFQKFRATLPTATLYNLYGTSESWDATWWDPSQSENSNLWRIPIGKPITNVRTYVLDSRRNPVPVGVAGELFLGGMGVADGYVNQAALSEKRFVPDPFARQAGHRLYRTGDLARWLPDGNLEFLGRVDHQVKLRGYRVELGEIEAILERHPAVTTAAVLIRNDSKGEERLTAYVVPASETSQDDLITSIGAWQSVWDNVYQKEPVGRELAFSTNGFISSYTGEPLPESDVREWVDEAVQRIAELAPRRILEIGCGIGLILFRAAPRCEYYLGTDLSPAGIEFLRRQLTETAWNHVEVRCRPADDFGQIPTGSFDLVVLHSVIQYFPDINYLIRVIEQATNALRPGGSLFIGDVRSLPLAYAFYTSVELAQVSAGVTAAELGQRVRRRMTNEPELLVAPPFFASLAQHLPGIQSVIVEPKRGAADNEFNRFRYNVVLHTSKYFEHSAVTVDSPLSPESLKLSLARNESPQLAVLGISNLKVASAFRLGEAFASTDALVPVGSLLESTAADANEGIEPAVLCSVAHEAGFQLALRLKMENPARYDALLSRTYPANALRLPVGPQPPRPWSSYANQPARRLAIDSFRTKVRSFLERELPEHMIPSFIVPLDAMPLTPSGKIDRRALPEPDPSTSRPGRAYVGPRNPVEEQLCVVWSDLLGLNQVSVLDDFFADLGGHSLLATRLVSRLRELFSVEFPLRSFFENPTVAGVASAIESQRGSLLQTATLSIKPVPREQKSIQVTGDIVEVVPESGQHSIAIR